MTTKPPMEYATPLTIVETRWLLGRIVLDRSEIARAVRDKLQWNIDREENDKANGSENNRTPLRQSHLEVTLRDCDVVENYVENYFRRQEGIDKSRESGDAK